MNRIYDFDPLGRGWWKESLTGNKTERHRTGINRAVAFLLKELMSGEGQ